MPHSVLVDQAAALLGVSRRTIYYRIREGKLSTLRTRCGSQRVLMTSLERLMRERGLDFEPHLRVPAETRRKTFNAPPTLPAAAQPEPDDLTMVQDAGV
jgi:excisionase family DNA binding protein